jgi:hypothetical protein
MGTSACGQIWVGGVNFQGSLQACCHTVKTVGNDADLEAWGDRRGSDSGNCLGQGVLSVGVMAANVGGETVATVNRKWIVVVIEKGGFADGTVGTNVDTAASSVGCSDTPFTAISAV